MLKPYIPSPTAAERSLKQQLQQNHVDLQRLWIRVGAAPQDYVGKPLTAPIGLPTA